MTFIAKEDWLESQRFKSIYLIGMPGAGKTTLGKETVSWITDEYGNPYEFVDLDEFIEKRDGRPVWKIINEDGIEAFREIEKKNLISLSVIKNRRHVISLGGGIVETEECREILKQSTNVIYLDVPVERLSARIANQPTRVLQYAESVSHLTSALKTIRFERQKYYQEVANYTLEGDNITSEDVLELISMSYDAKVQGGKPVGYLTDEEIEEEFPLFGDLTESNAGKRFGAKWMRDKVFGKYIPRDLLVKSAYKFPNGQVATFNYKNEQLPELQGTYDFELRKKIEERSNDSTEWHGF